MNMTGARQRLAMFRLIDAGIAAHTVLGVHNTQNVTQPRASLILATFLVNHLAALTPLIEDSGNGKANHMSNRRLVLNPGQSAAEAEILAAVQAHTEFRMGDKAAHDWLLLGSAGTGKTTLMQSVVRKLLLLPRKIEKSASGRDKTLRVAVCAPTHKAVQVLKGKLIAAGLEPGEKPGGSLWAGTIHSVLGLKPVVSDSERQELKRQNPSSVGMFDAVVIDEVSMISSELQRFIDADLAGHFVLYIGDPAQLPPVGEVVAPVFARMPAERTSVLTQIVRQAEGNPILRAATALRLQQGKGVDWSWCHEDTNGRQGVYLAGAGPMADEWMQDAFTSAEFRQDNDAFRYVAWTNERVHAVNAKVRNWIYGETPTPFVPGERVICRQPVLSESGAPIFATNEEAVVTSIEADTLPFRFMPLPPVRGWEVTLPVWAIKLEGAGGTTCYLPRDRQQVTAMDRRLVAEAKQNRLRWRERFAFLEGLADLRPVYAMTSHTSQGSTFGMGFVDVQDIGRAMQRDTLMGQQMMYVALTRFSEAVVLVG